MRPDDWLEDLDEPDLDEPDLDVDELIQQITVDAYGDEGYWSFRQAFEDHIGLDGEHLSVLTDRSTPLS